MRFHEALAALAPTKGDGYITRAGGPMVRNAVGPAEQAHHRYVVDAPEGVAAFEATSDDHAADWTIGSRKADAEKAKAEADAKAKADAEKAKGPKKD